MKTKAKILYYDIETCPLIGTAWDKWEANIIWIIKDWYILSVAWKWAGQKKVQVIGLPDFKTYKKDPEDDIEIVRHIHGLFSEADIVVAHNGDQFDQKKSQARMIIQGLDPPQPYRQIDTKKVARKHFNFTSNSLDDLGQYLKLGKKLSTDKSLWKKCMAGDAKAWKRMKAYNKEDVVLLEKVYLKMRPWMTGHPPINLIENELTSCPLCGQGPLQKRGTYVTKAGKKQHYWCLSCRGWSSTRISEHMERPMYVS